jgi:hypothetical protein
VGLRSGSLVLLPDFDRLITFGGDHAEGATVELDVEDACLARQRPWLDSSLDLLEVVATCPIKEAERTVVSATH